MPWTFALHLEMDSRLRGNDDAGDGCPGSRYSRESGNPLPTFLLVPESRSRRIPPRPIFEIRAENSKLAKGVGPTQRSRISIFAFRVSTLGRNLKLGR
jgi:hypothetical protein